LKLVLYTIPFCSIGRGIFLFGDIWPDIGQFGIDFKKYFLPFRDLVFFTERAVDALVWVDYQKVGAFIKTVYRANFYTVCVLALDAVVSDDKGHGLALVSMFGVPIRAAL
jgi:hypothetical protein